MTKARARVFSTPPTDAAARPFSCAVPSDPLRPLTLLSPSATPACPRLCSVPRSRTPRPARVPIPIPQRRALPLHLLRPPHRPSAIPRPPPFAAASLPRFPAPRGTRSRTFSLPAASGMPRGPVSIPVGRRGLPVFRSPSRNAAPRPCIFSALRTIPSRYRGPAFRRRLPPAFPRAFSLFPGLRTTPRHPLPGAAALPRPLPPSAQNSGTRPDSVFSGQTVPCGRAFPPAAAFRIKRIIPCLKTILKDSI